MKLPPDDDDRDAWAYEVGQILTAALTRLDMKERRRCPLCAQLWFDEDRS